MPVLDSAFIANTLQPHFSKKLLEKAEQEVHLIEFAQLTELPANAGTNTITFFRPGVADLTATGAPAVLTEGVTPTARRAVALTPISCTLEQIGQTTEITDVANNIQLFNHMTINIDVMSEEFSQDVETRLRNPLCHATTGLTKRYGQGLADHAALKAATTANGRMKPSDLLDGMTRLKLNRAPKINGWYAAYFCPQIVRDVMNDQEWREVVRENHANRIFKGEVGEYFGCKITEGTMPWVEDETEGTYDDTFDAAGTNTTGAIFTNFLLGRGAFGAVNMKKMGASMNKPSVIINDKPDKSDPLNQKIIAGWKAYWKNIILNPAWGIALRTKTQFAG